MALVQLGEGVCLAVANTLATYLNAELDAVNAVYASSDVVEFEAPLPLEHPAKIFPHNQAIVLEIPSIVVSWLGFDESANGAPQFGEVVHRIDVSVLCAADRFDVSEAQALRYIQAMWTVFKLHQQLDGSLSGLSGINTPRAGKSPAYGGVDGRTITGIWAGLELAVSVVESISA